jgi:hypothetical protein
VRLVLDTNTALSGLLWGGTPGRLIDAAEEQRIQLASSAALLAELQHCVEDEEPQVQRAGAVGTQPAQWVRGGPVVVAFGVPAINQHRLAAAITEVDGSQEFNNVHRRR